MSTAWIDGKFVDGDDTRLPTLDGEDEGLFETLRVHDGRPERLSAHLDRLYRGAPWLTADRLAPRAELEDACRSLPARAGLPDGRMRVTAVHESTAVTLESFAGYPGERYEHGADVDLAPAAGHPLGERAGWKAVPYTRLLRPRSVALQQGHVDVVFHALDGALLEGAATSLFLVFDGELVTPPLSRGILPGVTRAAVLDAARALGVGARESDVFVRDLGGAAEAFLTGSLIGVMPLRRIGDVPIPIGPLTSALRQQMNCRA